MIIQATRSEAPAKLASRLAKPLEVDNLRVLKDVLTPEKFKVFQDAVKTDFLSKPDQITSRLAKFDKETLDALLTKIDQIDLKFVGDKIDELNRIGIKKVVQDQHSIRNAIQQLTIRNDKAGLLNFIRRVERLPSGDVQRRAVRAAIVEDVYEKVVVPSAKGPSVDGKALLEEVTRLRKDGIFDRVLTAEDRRAVLNFERIAEFMKTAEDSGTSLQAAAAASNLRQLNWEGFRVLAETLSTGRLFTNPAVQRIMLGKGNIEKLPFTRTRVLGAILAQELSSAGEETATD